MPSTPNAAKEAARVRMAATGEKYTTALRHILSHPPSGAPARARDYLAAVLEELRVRGWSYEAEPEPWGGLCTAYAGPAAGVRIDVGRNGNDEDNDPDDPGALAAAAPLYLCALCPPDATVDDLDWGADGGAAPQVVAGQLDAELARVRLRLVHGKESESRTPCPICGDRYPARHLLTNSPSAHAVCPACVFDGDQHYRTDLPHLAVQLDRLAGEDLSAPAGWDAVAAVLALCCGANLGSRVEREVGNRGGFPMLTDRWHHPLERSWIWLPPAGPRHPAFSHLGAGATVRALLDALDRHSPSIRSTAKAMCREDGIRWRDSLWASAVAYAVAFTTQAHERHRHRKPVHVVDSTSDGLSQINEPFRVQGDALNIEGGLQALLDGLLFPFLLGHGLHDEPREPARQYGAEPDDGRPPRQPADAHVTHGIDQAVQVAIILGKIPGHPAAEGLWDGPPGAAGDAHGPFGSTASASSLGAVLRDEFRQALAGAMIDSYGPAEATADCAWRRMGFWIPADDAGRAVRQARDYLSCGTEVQVLWAGPGGTWSEPEWVDAEIVEVAAHCNGSSDAAGLDVLLDGGRSAWLLLSDIVAVQRPPAR